MKTIKSVNLIMCMLAAMAATACSKKDDATAVRQLIDKGAQMAEAHALGDLMRLTTRDFQAMPGHHDTPQVKGILFMAFQHYGKLKIHYPRPSVDVAEDRAAASSLIHFVIVSQDKTIPELKELYEDPQQWIEVASEKADLYQLELQLAKTDGDWRIKRAELKGFKGWRF